MTRSVEPLSLIEPGHLRFYSCGPTVYSYAHIGNFRSFLTADLIYRTARTLGWDVSYATNITDVGHLTQDDLSDPSGEDRMVRALRSSEGGQFPNIWDLSRFYTDELLVDWRQLNLLEPTVRPRATEHMQEQIRAVQELLDSGWAYETSQGIYYSVSKFLNYGKLSGNEAAAELAQSVRDVVVDSEKKDPRDFALWKKDDKHLMQWFSPWGWGFPGWHIECSVMAMTYLGDEIDLHAGGEDLIFPHHECEIAQSESLSGKRFARHWVHTRFLQVEGKKMSKRTGNFYTVRDIIRPETEGGRGIDPLALRLTLLSGYYRKPFNFTFDTLKTSIRHRERFKEAIKAVDAALDRDDSGEDRIGKSLDTSWLKARGAMLNDLNTPQALTAAFEGLRIILADQTNMSGASARSARQWLSSINDLLGIVALDEGTDASSTVNNDLDEHITQLVHEREQARVEKDFARADEIRRTLDGMDIEIMDTPDGPRWKRRVSV